LRTGRKAISLDSEHGLRELYGLLKNPDNRVPTYEEKVAREMAQKAEEIPTEIPRTSFFGRLRNIGKGISEFLSAPNKEAERLRRFETQSHEQLKETFKESGRRLRGISGFLRGLGAATFAGGKEGLKTATETFLERMGKSKSSAQDKTSGELAPTPGSL